MNEKKLNENIPYVPMMLDWRLLQRGWTYEQKGMFYDITHDYWENGQLPIIQDQIVEGLFLFAKPKLDASRKKLISKRLNGQKGGPKKIETDEKETEIKPNGNLNETEIKPNRNLINKNNNKTNNNTKNAIALSKTKEKKEKEKKESSYKPSKTSQRLDEEERQHYIKVFNADAQEEEERHIPNDVLKIKDDYIPKPISSLFSKEQCLELKMKLYDVVVKKQYNKDLEKNEKNFKWEYKFLGTHYFDIERMGNNKCFTQKQVSKLNEVMKKWGIV